MKRLVVFVLVTAVGFCLALLVRRLLPVSAPLVQTDRPLAVSICELNRNPELYDKKLVRVKAVLHGNRGNPYVVDETCGSSGPLSMIRVSADTDPILLPLPAWATYSSFCGNDTYPALLDGLSADVVIAGVFDSSQSQIIPRIVLQLSPASEKAELDPRAPSLEVEILNDRY